MPPRHRRSEPGHIQFGVFKKMLAFGKNYVPAIIIAGLFAIGNAMITIVGPEKIDALMKEIQNGLFVVDGVNIDAVASISVTLIVLYGTAALLSFAGHFISVTVTQLLAKRLRSEIDRKINAIPLSFFDATTKGDILSTVTNDVTVISQTLSQAIAEAISAIALFVGVLIKMFIANALLASVTIASAALGFAVMSVVMRLSQKYYDQKQQDLGRMNGQIEEVFSNQKIIRIFGGKAQEKIKYINVNQSLYVDNWKSSSMNAVMRNFMGFTGNLSYVLIFIVGATCIVNGWEAVDLGTIVGFVLYAKLFSQPLSTFGQAATYLQQSSAAGVRIFALLEQEELSDETSKTSQIDHISGEVVFDNVRFGYTPEREIIHGFNASVKPGQKVAIVGPTGAGKTTLVNLLMRFYEVGSGDIRIDGVSISDLKRKDVHAIFDMILQDTWLFAGTIRENLIFNKDNVNDNTLEEVCRAVGIRHLIQTLPQGYDTPLSEALNLSEGQKQQMTIARAMIKNSPLLILDEATSSVDTRTEILIQNAMDELTKGRTSFVIAHRLSTIRNADLILVLNEGDIVEQGTHEELLQKGGFYSELYNAQFAA